MPPTPTFNANLDGVSPPVPENTIGFGNLIGQSQPPTIIAQLCLKGFRLECGGTHEHKRHQTANATGGSLLKHVRIPSSRMQAQTKAKDR